MSQSSQQHIWSHFQNDPATHAFEASHARHAAIVRKIRRLAGSSKPAVLNIGVGDGNLEIAVQALGYASYSLDPDAEAIGRIRQRGIDARAGFIEQIPFDDSQFDFVVAAEILEHLTEPQRQAGLAEIRRTLKPGGYLIGTVPCEEDLDSNIAVCPHCRQVFHRWGHTTSFDLASLRGELAPYFGEISCRRTAFVEFRNRSLSGKLKSLARLVMAKCGAAIAMPSIFFVARKRGA